MPNPWEMDWSSPQQAPAYPGVIKGAPDPYKAEDQQMQREANARAAATADRQAAAAERAASAAERADTAAGRLSVSDNEALRRKVAAFGKLYRSARDFKDDFTGLGAGLENTAQAYSPISVGTPGQRDWWSEFKAADNLIRNELFGASLSGGEKSAYGETTVEPGMNATEVRTNVTRRVEEARAEMGRLVNSLYEAGYNRKQIDALLGEYGPIIRGDTPQPTSDRQDQPPVIGAGVQTPPAASTPPAIGGPVFAPDAPKMEAASGNDRRVEDPETTAKIDTMLRKGASLGSINSFLSAQGMSLITESDYAKVRDFLKQHPDYKDSVARAWKLEPISGFDKVVTSLGDNPVGAYFAGAGQFLSGNTLDNLANDPERARASLGVLQYNNPNATALGEVSGGIMGSLGGEAALGRAGMAPGMLRGVIADAGMGAANAAGAADGPGQNRIGNALLGGTVGAAGSVGGSLTARGLNSLARGVTSPAVRRMQTEVGPLTVGQTYGESGRAGAFVRGVEDRLSGLPVVGDMVNARRAETVTRFNAKAFDKALEPIGERLDGQTGADAVEAAAAKVQDAFARALQGKVVQADPAFANELTQATTKAFGVSRVGPELGENIADILSPHMQGNTIDGETMQIISRELRALKAAYKTKEPALYKRIAAAIDSTENAVFGMFKRQAPEVLPAYNAAKQAYRRVSILSDATLRGKNQPGNQFTAAQLNAADAANAKKYDGAMSAASGPRQFRDYGEAGQAVLPNKVPDSGTAGRLLVGGAGVGAIAGGGLGAFGGDPAGGAGTGAGTGLTMAAILAGAYTKAGQRVLTKPGRGMQGRAGQMLSDPRLQRILSKIGGASAAASLPGTAPSP